MLPRELVELIAAPLELAGVTRRQISKACEKMPTVHWSRLPLYSDVLLDSEPLQPFLKVRTDLDLEGFVAVYEEFVAGYLLTHELREHSPAAWLTRNLALTPTAAAHLFSDGTGRPGRRPSRPRDLLLMTVALAALANYTYGGMTFESPTVFQVSVSDYKFGIVDGKPTFNLGKCGLGPRIAIVKHPDCLVHAGRGRVVAVEPSDLSIFGQLKAWGAVNPDLVGGSLEAWNLALTVLRWQGRGHEPRRLNAALADGVDTVAFRQAVRLASGFQQFDRPYKEMQLLLVPAFVKLEDFRDLFGLAPKGRLTAQRAEQWQLALDHLSETIKETQ